ncbi:MAG TPA: aminotransferase class V-fold PLP-dependent enzyme [Methanoregulaceae archaeon]|nr:aminotransferase class V-fold PLP-dependent enzyme [Methanoregulaceae archaeon]
MVRSGLHCCEPLMRRLGLPGGTVRASLHCYSNAADIETLLAGVEECAHGA